MAERDDLLLALGAATIPTHLEVVVAEGEEASLEMIGKYKPRVQFRPDEPGPDQWRRDIVDNTNTTVSGSIAYHSSASAAISAVLSAYSDLINPS